MIETLSNLKNNKVKKAIGGGANGTGAQEVVERLKKFLSGMNKKRHGEWPSNPTPNLRKPYGICAVKSHEPLRVTLEDLRSAEKRGKWWLVGAAWSGDPLTENKENRMRTVAVTDQENKLLKLARKQGMNTDIRRSIFVVLMSSEVSRPFWNIFALLSYFSERILWMLAKGLDN
jgi:nucleolar MIF4G domain-containing protein 1